MLQLRFVHEATASETINAFQINSKEELIILMD